MRAEKFVAKSKVFPSSYCNEKMERVLVSSCRERSEVFSRRLFELHAIDKNMRKARMYDYVSRMSYLRLKKPCKTLGVNGVHGGHFLLEVSDR